MSKQQQGAGEYRPEPVTPSLGAGFFDEVFAAEFPRAITRFRNQRWAERVGLGGLDEAAWIDHFARFSPLPGNLERPLALRYHGYQFRAYNPFLGDGRGFLFAQLREPGVPGGRLLDLSTKGSGQTPWSRGGDGKLTLKGGVREVLAAEMLEALGVNTCKIFSLIETGESLWRGDEPSPTRSSVMVRLCHGSVRFGSFERLAHGKDKPRLEQLVDFCLTHYARAPARSLPVATTPATAATEPAGDRARRLFRHCCQATAELGGAWMAAGFVHGVLNTDNMSVAGESFDYGPYRFLPSLDPAFVAAYFDESGLYAYGRQPEVLRWNLERLSEALSSLCPVDDLRRELASFEARVLASQAARLLARLGLRGRDPLGDAVLVSRCQCFLQETRMPLDRFFFDWWGGRLSEGRASRSPHAALYATPRFAPLRAELLAAEPAHPALAADPYLAREAPVTLVIDEIEAVWKAIDEHDDWGPFARKVDDIRALGRVMAGTLG
jgi:serine/tyrosine/threonine adenylyltransferase